MNYFVQVDALYGSTYKFSPNFSHTSTLTATLYVCKCWPHLLTYELACNSHGFRPTTTCHVQTEKSSPSEMEALQGEVTVFSAHSWKRMREMAHPVATKQGHFTIEIRDGHTFLAWQCTLPSSSCPAFSAYKELTFQELYPYRVYRLYNKVVVNWRICWCVYFNQITLNTLLQDSCVMKTISWLLLCFQQREARILLHRPVV